MVHKERFSLLLLNPGEIYFEDFGGLWLPSHPNEQDSQSSLLESSMVQGRLHVCSQSVIFEPMDWKLAILKLPFSHIDKITTSTRNVALSPDSSKSSCQGIQIKTRQTVELLKHNKISPYKFINTLSTHFFSFPYVEVDCVFSILQSLTASSSLPLSERELHQKNLLHHRRSCVKFNMNWLQDFNEHIQLELGCCLVKPLVSNPGKVILTSSNLYFQPLNNIHSSPVDRWKLSSVVDVRRRRFLLQPKGIEIFFTPSPLSPLSSTEASSQSSTFSLSSAESPHSPPHAHSLVSTDTVFYSFDSSLECDQFYAALLSSVVPHIHSSLNSLQPSLLHQHTLQWQNGSLSNYQYLLYLNHMADRSFNDLTQYPIFPWVLVDYTSDTLDLSLESSYRDLSKPVGALNPSRLQMFQDRYQQMPDPKFLYGSHYSSPGYVLFFLVRLHPQYMLCLQNGRFDVPNRLFHSIHETWTSALHSPTDVRELIPEFYQNSPNFLLNRLQLPLGIRENGVSVHDVILPPWAKNASHFLETLSRALESDYVSAHLHHWIDLIFGYKQKGQEAIAANNLFYHLTYEGAVDLENIQDPVERASLEAQIFEFGQTPIQLFQSPHPTRNLCCLGSSSVSRPPSASSCLSPSDLTPAEPQDLFSSPASLIHPSDASILPRKLASPPFTKHIHAQIKRLHKSPIAQLCISKDGNFVYTVGHDGYFKISDILHGECIQSVHVSPMTLSSCALFPHTEMVALGCWDNHVYFFSLDYGRIVDKWIVHDDAVTSVCIHNNTMLTASWDGSYKIWDIRCFHKTNSFTNGNCIRFLQTLFTDHETEIKSCIFHPAGEWVASGSLDGTVILSSIMDKNIISQHALHSQDVTSLLFNQAGSLLISASTDQSIICVKVPHFEIVFQISLQESVRSLHISPDDDYLIAAASSIRDWSLPTGTEQPSWLSSSASDIITCIHLMISPLCSSPDGFLITGDVVGTLSFYSLKKLNQLSSS